MSGLVVKAAVLFAWTRALRELGLRAGPHRIGLLLGLPSTTAVALVACGREHGAVSAIVMADAGLLGLAAAVALPAAYARAVEGGRPHARAVAAALACYAAVAAALAALPPVGPAAGAVIAALAIAAADRRGRHRAPAPVGAGPEGRPRGSAVSRALAPAACLVLVTLLRDAAGAGWAGLLTPFPATTLALLVATHAEAGPAAALRMAAAVPRGNFGTLAFLLAFRSLAVGLGPAPAAAWGCAAALAALLAVEATTRRGADRRGSPTVARAPSHSPSRRGPGPRAARGRRRSRGASRIAADVRTGPAAPLARWSLPRPARSPPPLAIPSPGAPGSGRDPPGPRRSRRISGGRAPGGSAA